MKGILTDCHTGEDREIEIDYEIVEIKGEKIFQLFDGPTGYESFYIDSEYNHLENVCDNGWTACCGTKGIWDKLFIPPKEIRKALAQFLEAKDEKVVIRCCAECKFVGKEVYHGSNIWCQHPKANGINLRNKDLEIHPDCPISTFVIVRHVVGEYEKNVSEYAIQDRRS